jgi:hypothetical protein
MSLSSSGGTSGFTRPGDGGVLLRISWNTTAVVAPVNGGRPVAISYSTTPKENRSLRASSRSPRACSGDM